MDKLKTIKSGNAKHQSKEYLRNRYNGVWCHIPIGWIIGTIGLVITFIILGMG